MKKIEIYIPWNPFEHSSEFSRIFLGIFLNIPRNLLEHSPESLITFPGIFSNIHKNLFKHSPETSHTYPGIVLNIPQNLLEFFQESCWTSPRILNWWYSQESSKRFPRILVRIPCVLCISRISFPVLAFLVL